MGTYWDLYMGTYKGHIIGGILYWGETDFKYV